VKVSYDRCKIDVSRKKGKTRCLNGGQFLVHKSQKANE